MVEVDTQPQFERVRVVIETNERTFRGFLYKPVLDENHRLSDYLNSYERPFICVTDVQVNERGQQHRVGDRREFVAVAISAITYIAPIKDGEM